MKIKKEVGILFVSALVLYPMLVFIVNALSNVENHSFCDVLNRGAAAQLHGQGDGGTTVRFSTLLQ